MLKEALSRMVNVFLPTVLVLGQEYQQKGYVLNIRLSDGLLKARVKGQSSKIYDVHIDLKSWPSVAARCTCDYRLNCKHAAASLFALKVRENLNIATPSKTKSMQSLELWLNNLREKEQELSKIQSTHDLIYLIELKFSEFEHRVLIRLAMAKRLKNGRLGKKLQFHSITESRKASFLKEDDEIIEMLLAKTGSRQGFDYFPLRSTELLEKILATGRVYLASEKEKKITAGKVLEAKLVWQLRSKGTQNLVLEAEDEEVLPLILDQAWYYDREESQLGLLKSPYSTWELKRFLNAPALPVNVDQEYLRQITEAQPELPIPQTFKERKTKSLKPRPVVCFDAMELEDQDLNQSMLFVVELFFDYEGLVISKNEIEPSLFYAEEDCLIEIQRDFLYEEDKAFELKQILTLREPLASERKKALCLLSNELVLAEFQNESDLRRLYTDLIPQLKSKGWEIKLEHSVYEELVNADELEWFSEFREKGNDFFSYQLGILVDGNPINIVPLVAELISRLGYDNLEQLADDERIKLAVVQGKTLELSFGRIKPLLRFLLQYGLRQIKSNESLQINRYQLILMQETEQAMAAISSRWRGSEILSRQLQFTTGSTIPIIPTPLKLKTQLRDYQQEGLNWLQFLRQSRFGGILADDMGLGKTIQTLAHLQVEKEQGRLTRACLIVAPTSLVENWFVEAKRFTPDLKVLVFHGYERHGDDFSDYDLIISTYGLIQRDKARFIDYSFYYLILDEAQSIKNARTKTTQIIQQIQAEHRLCLTGTPLENHLGELWSLFNFLMPGLLGDAKQFRQFFKTPIEKLFDKERRTLLAKRVKPFLLRRTKNQVVKELPAKTEMTQIVELEGSQRDLYEAIRLTMNQKVREAIAKQGMGGKSHIILLDALLKLRQVCCDPRLLAVPEAEQAYGNSAKLEALMELVDSLVEEGRKILVFSQFTSMLELIEKQLKTRHLDYLKLTGQTQNRQALVDKFQEGKTALFLISLKAGGTGLNLTKADTVIHYDPWWNPAVEDQATDRSHRIGQENPVFVYKLITSGTVEEIILSMQEKKRRLFEGILSDNPSELFNLTKQDIEQFFRPLP